MRVDTLVYCGLLKMRSTGANSLILAYKGLRHASQNIGNNPQFGAALRNVSWLYMNAIGTIIEVCRITILLVTCDGIKPDKEDESLQQHKNREFALNFLNLCGQAIAIFRAHWIFYYQAIMASESSHYHHSRLAFSSSYTSMPPEYIVQPNFSSKVTHTCDTEKTPIINE